jgi:hypothetical protein
MASSSTSAELERALAALLDFRLAEWRGLPPCLVTDLAHLYGPAVASEQGYLGSYPVLRETFLAPPPQSFSAYSRAGRVVAVETGATPPIAAADGLGEPDARLPGEFALPGFSVREHLYCRIGLVLSVARAVDPSSTAAARIVRCRGIAALATPLQYDAQYYLACESRIVFE